MHPVTVLAQLLHRELVPELVEAILPLNVAHFVGQHPSQFSLVFNYVQQPTMEIDIAAHGGKGVDAVIVNHLKPIAVGRVLASGNNAIPHPIQIGAHLLAQVVDDEPILLQLAVDGLAQGHFILPG